MTAEDRMPGAGEEPDTRNHAGTFHRLHPMTLVYRFIVSLPALVFILLPVLRSPDATAWFSITLAIVYGIVVVPLLILHYLRFRYAVTPREIIIHKGVFTYQHRNIPIDRVQNVEIEQSLLPRLMSMAKVHVETAGSSGTEGVIEYVSLEQARSIRATIRAHQRARAEIPGPGVRAPSADADGPPLRDESGETEFDFSESPGRHPGVETYGRRTDAEDLGHAGREADFLAARGVESPRPVERRDASLRLDDGLADGVLHEMSVGRVLLAGMFRFSLLYIVIIFSATEYLRINPDDVARWLAGDRIDAFTAALEASPVLVIAATAAMVLFFAWITGIVTTLNRFYGFRLTREGDKLHMRSGLLTVSEGTIPIKKVQALVVRTTPLMAAFGWYRLELQTIGFDAGDRGDRVAVPFARSAEVNAVAKTIRRFEMPEDFRPVSPIMIRRTFARYSVVLLVASGLVGLLWRDAFWAMTALPLLLAMAFRQYHWHGYVVDPEFLFVRRGVFRRSIWIIPIERFQVFYTSESVLQRWRGLRSAYVDTPGAGAIGLPMVVDLPAQEATDLVDVLYATFSAYFGTGR